MATTIDIADYPDALAQLVRRVSGGEDLVLTEAGVPVARLVAEPEPAAASPRREIGGGKGTFWMSDDFNEMPADLLADFEKEDLEFSAGHDGAAEPVTGER